MQKQFLQLLKDNAQREASSLRVENAATEATIYLYDVIDPYFGVGAAAFNKELSALKGKQVHLRINSPGGDVFDGRAMATAIAQHGNVIAHIDGLAASAATYVATAAKEVRIADGSFFMIHNAWTMAYGNKSDLTNTADLLDKIDQTIISSYVKKTGKPAEEIAALMNAETWLTAQEAVDMGFADAVVNGPKVENKWNLDAFDNAPKIEEQPVEPDESALLQARNANRLRLYEIV